MSRFSVIDLRGGRGSAAMVRDSLGACVAPRETRGASVVTSNGAALSDARSKLRSGDTHPPSAPPHRRRYSRPWITCLRILMLKKLHTGLRTPGNTTIAYFDNAASTLEYGLRHQSEYEDHGHHPKNASERRLLDVADVIARPGRHVHVRCARYQREMHPRYKRDPCDISARCEVRFEKWPPHGARLVEIGERHVLGDELVVRGVTRRVLGKRVQQRRAALTVVARAAAVACTHTRARTHARTHARRPRLRRARALETARRAGPAFKCARESECECACPCACWVCVRVGTSSCEYACACACACACASVHGCVRGGEAASMRERGCAPVRTCVHLR
eukprot:6208581-Pleurochrysis_carterae.AAC.1